MFQFCVMSKVVQSRSLNEHTLKDKRQTLVPRRQQQARTGERVSQQAEMKCSKLAACAIGYLKIERSTCDV